jgi:hypothetical protein
MANKPSVDTSRGVIFPISIESPDDRIREFIKDYDDRDGYAVFPLESPAANTLN